MPLKKERPKEEENVQNRILTKLEVVEKRIDAIETSLRDFSTSRQMGWLVFGVVMGGLLSISVNLWTSYFMIVLEPQLSPFSWTLALILTTIGLVVTIIYLAYWAYKKIAEGT